MTQLLCDDVDDAVVPYVFGNEKPIPPPTPDYTMAQEHKHAQQVSSERADEMDFFVFADYIN